MWSIYMRSRVFITTTLLLLFHHQVLLQNYCCFGCLEEERMGLLELKAYWYNDNSNANGSFRYVLPSWNSKEKDSECCGWWGVKCSNTTRRVTELGLSYTRKYNAHYELSPPLHLNASLFMRFQELHTLDLSGNQLFGAIDEGLCKLKRLELLHLNGNSFEGILPSCLGNLTSLRVLHLSDNRFVGNIASLPLVNLVSLEELDLSYNQFKSLSPFSLFANHSKLRDFKLHSDSKELQVETEHPTNWIPTFQLQKFTLSNCTFINRPGVIPNFLSHQMDLIRLEISSTNLQGEFPTWLLRNNPKLEYLSLQDNSLTGPFDLSTLSQHSSNMYSLNLSNNHIHGHLPINIGTSLPNLRVLYLSNNSFHGGIPSSIGNLSSLHALDLSDNNLSGEIPKNLMRGCTSLGELKLSENQLHGMIPPLIFNMTFLRFLYLDGNHFTRMDIPQSLSLSLSSMNRSNGLNVLNVRDNGIMGRLPNWLGNMRTLATLYMSKNRIQGPIPETLCNLHWLGNLDLSDNNITGPIPYCFSPPFLKYLNLRRNGLTGSFMNNDKYVSMSNSTQLVGLDLGHNKISGSISSIINGSFLKLRILILKGNRIQGQIPRQLCHFNQISVMDLSFNYLSGPIPSCLANLTFKIVEDSSNFNIPINSNMPNESLAFNRPDEHVEFTSKKRNEIYKDLLFLSGIDLSSNQLTGFIPPEIGNLSQTHTLNFSHNYLTGTIPSTFSKLDAVESLDLSYNNLSGSIPFELVQLTSLAIFSVAHNNLSGKTPDRKAQFATFDESSYEGNPFLCGPPLKKNCSNSNDSVITLTPLEGKKEDSSSMNFVVFMTSFIVSFVIGFLGVVVVLYINPYWRRMWFHMVDEWIYSFDYFLLVVYYKLKHFVCT